MKRKILAFLLSASMVFGSFGPVLAAEEGTAVTAVSKEETAEDTAKEASDSEDQKASEDTKSEGSKATDCKAQSEEESDDSAEKKKTEDKEVSSEKETDPEPESDSKEEDLKETEEKAEDTEKAAEASSEEDTKEETEPAEAVKAEETVPVSEGTEEASEEAEPTAAETPTPTVTETPALTETPAPTEAPTGTAAPISGDAGVKVVYKADGGAFPMFKVTGSAVTVTGSGITISISSNKATYNKIQIEGVGTVEGVLNTDDTYNFTFTVSAEASGKSLGFVPYKTSNGEPYTSKELVIVIPDVVQAAPTEAPTPTPTETPAVTPTVTPTAAPTEAPTEEIPSVTPAEDRVSVLKEDGTEFKMFASVQTETSAAIKDGKIKVSLIISNENFDKIYLGSKDAEDKTPVITGEKLAQGGYRFVFELPETDKGTSQLVALGKPDDTWFEKYELYLYIPADIAEETPEPTSAPTPTAAPQPTKAPEETVTPTPTPASAKDGVYQAEASTNAAMFKVVGCELKVVNGKTTAHITLSGVGYDYLYMGTSAQAAGDTANWIKYDGVVTNSEGKEQRTYTIPVSALDTAIAVASHSESRNQWYDRVITIASSSLAFVRELTAEEQNTGDNSGNTDTNNTDNTNTNNTDSNNTANTEKDDEEEAASTSNGATSAVNTSTGLADGVYTPDSFSWSGGSGRLKGISCTKITVKNGQAWATIVFASSGYSAVSANGSQYGAISVTSSTSTFEIPVQLNANNRISGLTTKMSAAHWVDYVLYIGLEAAKQAGSSSTSTEDTLAGTTAGTLGETVKETEAPEITGLVYQESLKVEHAKYFKLHYYKNNIAVLEIDVTSDLKAVEEETAEAALEETVEEELLEEGETTAAETAETEDSLFDGEKILYVLAAEDTELPAGVEKEAVVVRIPAEKAYVDSEDVLEFLEELEAEESVIDVTDSYTELAFKDLIKTDCDLVAVPSDILPHEEDAVGSAAEQYAAMQELGDQLQVLDIPMIVDRSADEEDELAAYEWIKVYGAVFGYAKEAQALYSEAE